jgi:hypothetical protein
MEGGLALSEIVPCPLNSHLDSHFNKKCSYLTFWRASSTPVKNI